MSFKLVQSILHRRKSFLELLHLRLGQYIGLGQGEDLPIQVVDGLGSGLEALVHSFEAVCDSSAEVADFLERFCVSFLDILANSLHGSQELLHRVRESEARRCGRNWLHRRRRRGLQWRCRNGLHSGAGGDSCRGAQQGTPDILPGHLAGWAQQGSHEGNLCHKVSSDLRTNAAADG